MTDIYKGLSVFMSKTRLEAFPNNPRTIPEIYSKYHNVSWGGLPHKQDMSINFTRYSPSQC